MAVTVKVGSDYYGIKPGTLNVDNSLGERGVAQFQIHDTNSTYSFSVGENIEVSVAGDIVWSGVIERLNKQLPGGSTSILYTIRGISWNYAMDKRRIVSTYTSDVFFPLTADKIITSLITNYLSQEGITAGVISTGSTFSNVVFNYIQPSKCLDLLAEQSGYIWQINPNKTLDFKPHDYATFAFTVGSTEISVDSAQYIKSNPKYRNTQYIVGGYNLTDVSTEMQYGDSTKQAFVTPYVLMKVPAITTVRGGTSSTQSVGILGVDESTDYQWFWNKLSNIISQTATGQPLTATEKLKIEYTGGYPSVTASQNVPAIVSRRSVEGGTGVVEDVLNRGKDTLYADNIVLGNSLITKYSTVTDTLTFRTHTSGIYPGTILKVTFPEFGLSSEEMLVDSVRIQDVDGAYVWYNVSALTGPEHGGWSKYFDDFITRTIEKDIWGDALSGDIVSVSTGASEGFTWTEASTEAVFTCPLPCADTSTDAWNIYPNLANEARVSTGEAGWPC